MPVPEVNVVSDTLKEKSARLDVAAVFVERAAPPEGIKSFPLTIAEPDGKHFNLEVLPTDTIKFLKDAIWAAEDIPTSMQILIFD